MDAPGLVLETWETSPLTRVTLLPHTSSSRSAPFPEHDKFFPRTPLSARTIPIPRTI
jgi:hypothetical protein